MSTVPVKQSLSPRLPISQENLEMGTAEIFKLAQERGCTLKTDLSDNECFYWVENAHFISKPFMHLDELARLIHTLPRLSFLQAQA